MDSEVKEGTLTLFPEGKIDSGNATAVGAEMGAILSAHPDCKIVFNFSKLLYISSAGLREFLKIAKAHKNIPIIEVSPEVYEIFEVTGFVNIFHMTKKLREVSIDGCDIVGRGVMGIVYRLDQDTIIKVFQRNYDIDEIRQSLEMSKKLLLLGIPVAISYDIVRVGDSYGAVYEMLDCDTLGAYIHKHPKELDACAKKAAQLLREMHGKEIEKGILPDAKDHARDLVTEAAAYYTEEEKAMLLRLIDNVPDTNTFLHGDFHCGNIMINDGELIMIDIDDAATGDPVFDLAQMYITNVTATSETESDEECMYHMGMNKQEVRRFWEVFRIEYYGTEDPEVLREKDFRQMIFGSIKSMWVFGTLSFFPEEKRKQMIPLIKPRLIQSAEEYIRSGKR